MTERKKKKNEEEERMTELEIESPWTNFYIILTSILWSSGRQTIDAGTSVFVTLF